MLKHGETFAVFDRYGDATPGGLGELGLFHESTRFLSCSILVLEGQRPFFLSSTVHEDDDRFVAHLTNPDLIAGDTLRAPLGTMHLAVEKFLWQAACYQTVQSATSGMRPSPSHFVSSSEPTIRIFTRSAASIGQPADATWAPGIRRSSHSGLPWTRRRRAAHCLAIPPPPVDPYAWRGLLEAHSLTRRRVFAHR